MMTKFKMAVVRKLRDLFYWESKIHDEAAFQAAMEMARLMDKGGSKKMIDLNRKLYVLWTKQAMKGRNLVGKCNMFLIRNKST